MYVCVFVVYAQAFAKCFAQKPNRLCVQVLGVLFLCIVIAGGMAISNFLVLDDDNDDCNVGGCY